MISGNISDKITLVYRDTEKFSNTWEGYDKPIEFYGKLCFPADENSLETAIRWGEKYKNKFKKKEIDNIPFSVTIVDLDLRGEGGRAYKVKASIAGINDLLFDLREDMIMDIIKNAGIDKGGDITNAQFIFAKVGSQMKLVRVGSHLHDSLKLSMETKKQKPLKLEVGRMYGSDPNYIDTQYAGQFWTKDKNFKDVKVHVFIESPNGKYSWITIKKSHSYKFSGDLLVVDKEKIKDGINQKVGYIKSYYEQYSNYTFSAYNYYSHHKERLRKYMVDCIDACCLSEQKGYIHPEVEKIKDIILADKKD